MARLDGSNTRMDTQQAQSIGEVTAIPFPAAGPNKSVEPAMFINRDLSLLGFFRRVLEEAMDDTQPPLERLKFISILSSNLDEFFMIRVSGLKEKLGREVRASSDGFSTAELLSEIKTRVTELIDEQMRCLGDEILPELSRAGIVVRPFNSLSDDERRQLNEYFYTSIYPLLTPQAVDPTHPFPYVSGGSVNLGLLVKPVLNRRSARALKNADHEFFVRIKIPSSVPATISVGETGNELVLVEDLIVANIRRLVPDASPELCHFFRITRDADIDLREGEIDDLLDAMEENLKLRRFGDVVRLEVSRTMPAAMVEYLAASLDITEQDIYPIDGPLNAAALSEIYKIERPDLKDVPIRGVTPAALDGAGSTFSAIKRQDILLHHPYMPYSIVTKLIKEAVEDPDVLAIKMCLYRIGAESSIAPLLIEASEKGKQVTALIEIKARFDEENNIQWAKRLEQAGVHVVYGLIGLKTHCKTTLIIRRENDELVRYVHLATGNYNPDTSAFYTDLSLLTANKAIGEDATEIFNYLTVYSERDQFKHLVVAPIALRSRMVELIKREIDHAQNGRPARIIAKMNRLADAEIVNALYEASRAGVEIDLIVRGICTLRPGVSGLSENIRVRSIVGRLLEHSRLYYFENAGDPTVYTGSSDWMPRNLDRRVEVLAPILDPQIKRYLTEHYLFSYLKDNVKAREMLQDGTYRRVTREPGEPDFNSQESFQEGSNIVQFAKAH